MYRRRTKQQVQQNENIVYKTKNLIPNYTKKDYKLMRKTTSFDDKIICT